MTTIGEWAFYDCSGLTSIKIPECITTIGEWVFSYCSGLTSINIPDGVTSIGDRAFSNCSGLTSIYIPNSVTTIGEYAFSDCSGLTSIYIYGDDVKNCSYAFESCTYSQATLYVPNSLLGEYETTSPWSNFKNIVGMAEAPTNHVFPADAKTYAGKDAIISLMMNNKVEVTGYQCDVYLPAGVTFVKDEEGYEKIELSTKRTTNKNTDYFSYRMQTSGAMRILCSSTRSKTFSDNEGEVATMTVHVDKKLTPGEYPVILKNIVLSDPKAKTYRTEEMQGILTVKSYTLGDVNGDEEINVGDYTAIANHIQGEVADDFIEDAADTNEDGIIDVGDLTGVANIILLTNETTSNTRAAVMPLATEETTYNNLADYENAVYPTEAEVKSDGTATISVCMKNSVEVTGYQFDMYLPEGFTYAKDEDDYEMIELSTKRTTKRKTDFFSYRMQKSGAMRVLCSSTTSKTFSGNDGEVCTVVVKAPEGVKAGSYPVVLKNIVMSDPKAKTYKAENLAAKIIVSEETGISGISADTIKNCHIYSVDGTTRHSLGNGVNIIKTDDGKVVKVMK